MAESRAMHDVEENFDLQTHRACRRDSRMKFLTIGLALTILMGSDPSSADSADASRQAMRVLDDFMVAFNARDEKAWLATMHFPHVRVASGMTRLDETPEAMMSSFDFDRFAKQFDWHHSAWLSREVVQSGPDKVHVVVRFARYREDGSLSAEFDSFYIVARREGRWAVVGRSSFAP
jgi:hypothetical protein